MLLLLSYVEKILCIFVAKQKYNLMVSMAEKFRYITSYDKFVCCYDTGRKDFLIDHI